MSRAKPVTWIVLASALTLLACDREKGSAQNQPASAPAAVEPTLNFPPDAGPPPAFDAAGRNMSGGIDLFDLGRRPITWWISIKLME